jgi:uncharacterized protein (UPF0264 family)
MRLLVSVRNAAEAVTAERGGADLIDAKDPGSGALGPVTTGALRAIRSAVGLSRPVTAALGDELDESTVQARTRVAAGLGIAFVKIGFARAATEAKVRSLTVAAVRGAREEATETRVVGVAYADAVSDAGVSIPDLSGVIAGAGAEGLLIDTAFKNGPGLAALVDTATLTGWVRQAHALGLFVALAGKLGTSDLGWVRDAGADIAGVRGTACVGGREGRLAEASVRRLKQLCDAPSSPHAVAGVKAGGVESVRRNDSPDEPISHGPHEVRVD